MVDNFEDRCDNFRDKLASFLEQEGETFAVMIAVMPNIMHYLLDSMANIAKSKGHSPSPEELGCIFVHDLCHVYKINGHPFFKNYLKKSLEVE